MTNGYQVTDLTGIEQKTLLKPERGNAFGVEDRLFRSYTDDAVYLQAGVEARDLAEMLRRDGTARKIERVLSLPIRGATHEIVGTGPEADLVRGNVGPMLDQLIEQCTAAMVFRRAFFEKVWTARDGRIVYDKLAWRPPVSCDARFDEKTAVPDGFSQRLSHTSWWTMPAAVQGEVPGTITIPRHKAFVFVHGRHREPVNGVSELEVAYHAYETKQKLRFLWAQYLECQSLPKITVYGRDTGEAQDNAELYAQARASGVIPHVISPDLPRGFDVIESSGKGAGQFQEALRYYDAEQTNSVLAGFTDLATAATQGYGSYALSADASEFFLASEQAFADDVATQIGEGVFAPLVVLNFGVDAEVPRLRIGPIGNRQTDRALDVLKPLLTAPGVNAPDEFLDALLTRVAASIGLDSDELAEAIQGWRRPTPPVGQLAPAPEVEPGQQRQLDGMPQSEGAA